MGSPSAIAVLPYCVGCNTAATSQLHPHLGRLRRWPAKLCNTIASVPLDILRGCGGLIDRAGSQAWEVRWFGSAGSGGRWLAVH
eukprot:XP_001691518.1 predicted protein [Chlamydomonas reinhardtii]